MKSLIPWKRKERNAVPSLWVDDWFGRTWENPFKNMHSRFLTNSFPSQMPRIDVSEDKKEFIVRAELPGMTEKDIDLSWHDGVLRILGEKKIEKEENKKGRYYSECSYGSFSRDIALGDSADWKGAKAKYAHGVLTVKLPKTEKAREVIEIKVN